MIAGLLIGLGNFFSKEVRNFFYSISLPIQKSLWRAGDGISLVFDGIFSAKALKKENNELNLKAQELLTENAYLGALKKENEFLRQALDLGLEKEFGLKTARFIGRDAASDFILIDKGKRDGIREDFPVITDQKVVLGKVSEVLENFSKVMLVSSEETSFDVKVRLACLESCDSADASRSDAAGLARGKGNYAVYVDLIPKEKEIKTGDAVFTAALGGIFPEGLLVGQIEEIKINDAGSFQIAELKPAFSVSKLDEIFIIVDY